MSKVFEEIDNEERQLVEEKLEDAGVPGYAVEFDPGEAEKAGAFMEDALSPEEAVESSIDLEEKGYV